MLDWQSKINSIVESKKSNVEKMLELQYLRCEIVEKLHLVEDYVDKIDYCLYNLENEQSE